MARSLWLWLIGALLALGYVVPYTLLGGVEAWHGAFLFWLIFGLAVWVVLSLAVLGWNTPEPEELDRAGDRL